MSVRIILVLSVLSIALSGCRSTPSSSADSVPQTARESVSQGAILHCWCWSFKTIEENLPAIRDAGFSAIQTSPANTCIVGEDGGMDLYGNGKWYYQYQPTDWKIGNYQLGTRDDFISMCRKADELGIAVIVDVLPNHTTPDESALSEDFINAAGGIDALYHADGRRNLANYSDRLLCTTSAMGGLPDVDTENPLFQAYFLAYLNDLISCGADGFRFDTAKHIALPDDPACDPGRENDFWPVVTGRKPVNGVYLQNADSLFIYGEILQGNNSREDAYSEYIGVTASQYGTVLQRALQNRDFQAKNLSVFRVNGCENSIVTWVESHDNYANEGKSASLTNFELRAGYAAIASRSSGVPLFFNRPKGPEATQFPAGARIGESGNDEWNSPEVVAVNRFRTAMSGRDEQLSNGGSDGNDRSLLVVTRGEDGAAVGAVIINVSGTETVPFSIPFRNGTYTEHVGGGQVKVRGNTLSGEAAPESILVIW